MKKTLAEIAAELEKTILPLGFDIISIRNSDYSPLFHGWSWSKETDNEKQIISVDIVYKARSDQTLISKTVELETAILPLGFKINSSEICCYNTQKKQYKFLAKLD
jgi:hypothetical protein